MATKWKYAGLDAQQRLKLLRDGNKELFDEELARTREITNARRELGLDTSEQEDWMDKVGYSYSLSGAAPGDKVSKEGYAQLYLNEKKQDGEMSAVKAYRDGPVNKTSYISDAIRRIDSAREEAKKSAVSQYASLKENAKKELYGKYPYLEESLVNEGASPEGGKAARMRELIEARLEDIYGELDVELSQRLSEIDRKYAGLGEKIRQYRKNGTAKESLGAIADMLIKKASFEDDFDAYFISGTEKASAGKSKTGKDGVSEDAEAMNGEVSGKKAGYGIASERDSYEDNEDNNETGTEKVTVSGEKSLESFAKEIERLARAVFGDGRKAAEFMSGIFLRAGMNRDAAALAAAGPAALISGTGKD